MADDKMYIVDPLTCLCKVALLYFMPEKTRLAISHHVLYLQEYNYYQWFERKKNGDTRFDISHLNTPILKAIKWYILKGPYRIQMDPNTVESIRVIAKFAVKGFIKLQKTTYNDTTIAIKIILQYFINILRNALEDKWSDDEYVLTEGNNGVMSDKIKNGFEPHTFNSIAKILTDIDNENSPDNIQVLIDCAHGLLRNMDTVFVKMMNEINTTL